MSSSNPTIVCMAFFLLNTLEACKPKTLEKGCHLLEPLSNNKQIIFNIFC